MYVPVLRSQRRVPRPPALSARQRQRQGRVAGMLKIGTYVQQPPARLRDSRPPLPSPNSQHSTGRVGISRCLICTVYTSISCSPRVVHTSSQSHISIPLERVIQSAFMTYLLVRIYLSDCNFYLKILSYSCFYLM
jgi:hypothetical protein